jgi:hypothetical protein
MMERGSQEIIQISLSSLIKTNRFLYDFWRFSGFWSLNILLVEIRVVSDWRHAGRNPKYNEINRILDESPAFSK